ncbi:GlsB/YeaQ/YmgE family stress response membrane protein [Bradyrhizobium manausense]|uniref:GlsB/YeaQ/YmgE family stress response membrane protein n=1 Tax=Bradyrhizobium TaxID=374 RepID=UPI001BADC6DA|nr:MULTISPECIES: GlsB/YeaQ/YmgE family stress response membrane protein [Bradyrhizobium]MBR0831328.1 GlsB/YeaQ/YmgE family stress response membrane protein [Bradyrhizobium manausense]UVO27583.1 GlsB/YeaQ/YmgE family stress response membrane protein [Bradyrhizobium arachidis]
MGVLWTIIVGFVVGVIAKFIMPGDKSEPKGFILTAVLGIVGAFVATYLGQSVGWYTAGESAGFIASIVGAIILLFVYGLIISRQGRA